MGHVLPIFVSFEQVWGQKRLVIRKSNCGGAHSARMIPVSPHDEFAPTIKFLPILFALGTIHFMP